MNSHYSPVPSNSPVTVSAESRTSVALLRILLMHVPFPGAGLLGGGWSSHFFPFLRTLVSLQVPDDDQDGAGDGDQGFELAAALDDAPVAFAQEGVGPGGCRCGFTQDALEVGVCPCRCGRICCWPRTGWCGLSLAHDTRCPGVGNRLMSRPISAMIAWAPLRPDPGDLVQPGRSGQKRAGPVRWSPLMGRGCRRRRCPERRGWPRSAPRSG
jgi:hypothetical protein